MRLVAEARVRWPDRSALETWWRESLSLDRWTVDADGVVAVSADADADADADDVRLRLVEGQLLAPGSHYLIEIPGLERGEAVGWIGDSARPVHVMYREVADPSAA